MSWSRFGSYLSGVLLACAIAVAFAPLVIVIVAESHNIHDWLKTGVRPAVLFTDWYKIRLPHTSWVGLQRIFDWINNAPGPIVLLCACVCLALFLFVFARLAAGLVQRDGELL